ncbi:MAG: ExbD/TolR family protein [Opitutales bacterium]
MSAVTEINVTPLIDLAFSLLIIFMITTPLLEQTIPLDLPIENSQSTQSSSDVTVQTISIDEEGAYYWGEEKVDEDRLQILISDLARESDPPVVRVRADTDAPFQYQRVINVLSWLKEHKLSKVSLDTRVN